ncbi:hypothetical protein Nepgr_009279 [Nepenthes gracilis]|uniref:Uncharacterized protein n=1 Tax=Nepenthes gracilis TaxID=150966 RepID=A0AAD3XK69_NEPGR|nr:hypothetical protein Nepgr_009279 [Nepenthes gracilis]
MEISPESASDERLIVHATAGVEAGALAAVVTSPLDVVKTRLQCQLVFDKVSMEVTTWPKCAESSSILAYSTQNFTSC